MNERADIAMKLRIWIGAIEFEIAALTTCIQPHWWQFIKRRQIREMASDYRIMVGCYRHMLSELER